MRLAALLFSLLLLPLAAASPLLVPRQGDPDVPAATPPIASVQVFLNERFQFTEGHRTRDMIVPSGWDRVVMTWESRQEQDPWDRRFGVAIAGVEVLRGTTPRVAFSVSKDVTEYAALLSTGASVPISVHLGSWVGRGILASVRFDFYQDEPTAALGHRFGEVRPAAMWAYLGGGARAGADLTFADTAPGRAILEVTTSGHGQAGEFWWMETPPAVANFRVLVDGEEVGHLTAMPYVYALVGLGGAQSVVMDGIHTAIWWSAFRAADAAGVHVGVGEIASYRAEVDASELALFTGTRRVEIVQDSGGGSWVTSLTVLSEA